MKKTIGLSFCLLWCFISPSVFALDCEIEKFDLASFSDNQIVVAEVVTIGKSIEEVNQLLLEKGCDSNSPLCQSPAFDINDFFARYSLIEPNYRIRVINSLRGEVNVGEILNLPEHSFPALTFNKHYLLFLYQAGKVASNEYYVNPCYVSELGARSIPKFYFFEQSADEIVLMLNKEKDNQRKK